MAVILGFISADTQMSNKIKDEVVATVRSVVGHEYSEMDIIRALHMANNDATGAINIIFDTPNFRSAEKPQIRQNPRIQRVQVPSSDAIIVAETNENYNPNGELVEICHQQRDREIDCVPSGGEWWFVGYAEIPGMSTSKGRRIKTGDEVEFAFPKNKLSLPSAGKAFGRGKQAGACSEIVRFSTKSGGEVGLIRLCYRNFVFLMGLFG